MPNSSQCNIVFDYNTVDVRDVHIYRELELDAEVSQTESSFELLPDLPHPLASLPLNCSSLQEALACLSRAGGAATQAGNTLRDSLLRPVGIPMSNVDSMNQSRKLRYSQKLKGIMFSLLIEKQLTVSISLTAGRTQDNSYYIKASLNGWEFFGIFMDRPNHKRVAHFIVTNFINNFENAGLDDVCIVGV